MSFRADHPLPPFGNGHLCAVAFGLFGNIGLNLMLVSLAPYDEVDTRGGCVSERIGGPGSDFSRGGVF